MSVVVDRELARRIAESAAPLDPRSLRSILRDHAWFLETGGSGGSWTVVLVRGVPLGVYDRRSRKGRQASFRLSRPVPALAGPLHLPYADFCASLCSGLQARGANFEGCLFADADLRGADLSEAVLRHADLSRAELRGARLAGARAVDADFEEADLRGADLRGARLVHARLVEADLRGADLREADLRGANLRAADLRGARLDGANLDGADLRQALTDAPLDRAEPKN